MLSRILDSFLCEGREVLFRLALTLLMMAKSDLLQKDIEGVTKVCRNPNCNQLTDEYRDRGCLRRAEDPRRNRVKYCCLIT